MRGEIASALASWPAGNAGELGPLLTLYVD